MLIFVNKKLMAPPNDVRQRAGPGSGLGVDDDNRRSDFGPVVQLASLVHALQADAAVAPAIAGCVLAAVVNALTAAVGHEVRHVDTVQRADLVAVLGEDLERPAARRPGARTITRQVTLFGTVPGRHAHVELVVLQGDE